MLDPDRLQTLTRLFHVRYFQGCLHLAADLGLQDAWLTGSFVYSPLWDHFHGFEMTPLTEIALLYCDPDRPSEAMDQSLSLDLQIRSPRRPWTVRNVARDGHANTEAALRCQPDPASAVGIRQVGRERQVLAPLGLDALFEMTLVANPEASPEASPESQLQHFERLRRRWPKLRIQL